ncbi:hypothetical protein PHLCEN_2v11587 [Hermanssonia centrifuga]|uniref:BTB domain-containing protein n=1 Tax=Hermanssonia centrifuga TaxID=98765 RepID=A0A2R6NJQ3_9APHY|nr:hypothetical protein PHLCEN_2v11587 [Hermanssonia centrifuga]
MDDLEPSKKRTREDSEPLKIDRDELLWYEDGNIVLHVESTQFRVHKSILASKSIIFKDLFALAQSDDAPTVEDCPVLHLADSAEDMSHILDVLYHGLRWMVRAFLRIGDKYAITEIQNEALRQLEIYAPEDIENWDTLYSSDHTCMTFHSMEHIDIENNTQDPSLQHPRCGVIQMQSSHNP